MTINAADLIITVAYFSIPLQILASLWQYPRLAVMPFKIVVLLILFALFIFLCGAGHFLRCLHMTDTHAFHVTNIFTAVVSLLTALYLLPLIPNLLGIIDKSLKEAVQLNQETAESKAKLLTFMAFLCHEIRNPLFAITSSARFLSDSEMSEEQEVGVGSILDSSLLMLRLVNDVLDLSKIDAGKLELEERDFDLHRLLENLETNMRLQVKQKHEEKVKLEFEVSPEVPTIVYGDSIRMLQIVYNLVSNACKFTTEGSIKVSIGVCHDFMETKEIKADSVEDKNNEYADQFSMGLLDSVEKGSVDSDHEIVHLKIVVSDTGVGIDSNRIKQIFVPFSQEKLSDYRMHGGTGLGLSIISSLIKIMGGSINVSSRLGHGSTFTLRLPVPVSLNASVAPEDSGRDMSDPLLSAQRLPVYLKEEQPTNLQIQTATPVKMNDKADGSNNTAEIKRVKKDKAPRLPNFELPKGKCVVLVVDDNNVNRKILGKMLAFYNIEYELAVHGQDAVDKVRKSQSDPAASQFGLVFMDLSMPVMDGFEATEIIRKDGVMVPIVALTANALSQEKQRAYKAGATEFKTKPILREDLHALCSRYLVSPNDEND